MPGRAVAALVAVLALAGCGLGHAGWVFPTPAPPPAGAVPVAIDVAPIPSDIPSDAGGFGCPLALLLPVEMVVDRSVVPPAVTFRFPETGQPADLEWSWGVSAYELDGLVRVVAPGGAILMTEGQVATELGGSAGSAPNEFSVCVDASLPQRLP